jgi:hypothetical protein
MKTRIFLAAAALTLVFGACNKDLIEPDEATAVKAATTVVLPAVITPFDVATGVKVDAKAFDKFGTLFEPRDESVPMPVADGIFFVKTKISDAKNAKNVNILVFADAPTAGTLTVQTKINGNLCYQYVFDAAGFAGKAFFVENGTSVRCVFVADETDEPDYVCQIEGQGFLTLQEAMATIKENETATITLLKDIKISEAILGRGLLEIIGGRKITFDMSGFNLDVTNTDEVGYGIDVRDNSTLSMTGTGSLNATGGRVGIWVRGQSEATVTNAYATGTAGNGATVQDNCKLTVTGNVEGVNYGISAGLNSVVTVYGNVTGQLTGASAVGGSNITIEGTLTCGVYGEYVIVETIIKAEDDYTLVGGYRVYEEPGSGTSKVKVYVGNVTPDLDWSGLEDAIKQGEHAYDKYPEELYTPESVKALENAIIAGQNLIDKPSGATQLGIDAAASAIINALITKTKISMTTSQIEVTFHFPGSLSITYTVFWGDGTSDSQMGIIERYFSHTYTDNAAHTIYVTGGDVTSFTCSNMGLTDLDVSEMTNLTQLFCINNQLSHLDLTNNSKIYRVYCQQNPLEDVKAFIESLPSLPSKNGVLIADGRTTALVSLASNKGWDFMIY